MLLLILVKKDQAATFSDVRKIGSKREKKRGIRDGGGVRAGER